MAISDEERRRAAAELREAAGDIEHGDQLSDGAIVDVVYHVCLDGGVLDRCEGDPWEVDRDFFFRLADLVDRPTTMAVASDSDALDAEGRYIGMYECLACRAEVWTDLDSVTPYCPMCGAMTEVAE